MIYRCQKGNFVFNAGTCWWNMVLSTPPGFMNPPKRYFWQADPRIQRITRSILDRMIAAYPSSDRRLERGGIFRCLASAVVQILPVVLRHERCSLREGTGTDLFPVG